MRFRIALIGTVAAATLTVAGSLVPTGAAASPRPSPGASTADYTITVGSAGSFAFGTDSPASPYIDKDGTFYFQESYSNYGVNDPHTWDFYTGTTIDDASRSPISSAVNPANPSDRNDDTTWRCDHSPTGVNATAGGGYPLPNYCDLIGTWVDPDTGDWIGLVHNEFTGDPFTGNAGFTHFDAIDYAVSTDQGKVWTITGHAITSPYSTLRGNSDFPNQTWDYGDGDPRLFVDAASGYFYVFYGSRINPKDGAGGSTVGLAHVARAPISGKMATGTWSKWYNGAWSQPGVGGLESNQVPVTAANPDGYTPVSGDYDPANIGNADQQVAAGTLPPKSDLFIMNIAYDAYLGLYIGTPEAVNSQQPQRFYVTDDLSTQKWHLVGDTGSFHNQSWYRWLLDGANATNSTVIGKTFRYYCVVDCGNFGGYNNITVDSTSPSTPPVDVSMAYTIGNDAGRVLAQVPSGSATTSDAAPSGSAREAWRFTPNGDGSYRITNADSGQALGVDSSATGNRAWGTKPTVAALIGTTGSVGQQWFIIPVNGSTGSFKLVNRYSGLVLGLSSNTSRLAETTPVRAWTDTSGSTVGDGRTAGEQMLTFVPAATSGPPDLNGTHRLVASGKALDDPGHSTSAGTQLITWSPNGGANQNWVFTQQADGSYRIVNQESNLCMDDNGRLTTTGAAVIQWTCTGADNQEWIATRLSSGLYILTNVHSHLLVTTTSVADGSKVTQEADIGSALQQWSVQ